MADDPNPNPIPDRITEASWSFMLELLAMEPNTENAGIYANKAHYHNTRRNNQVSWPGSYSIQHPLDLQGPDDKAAAYDWTHNTAHGGDYRSMRKYGDRIKAAWQARDPRLYGWREAQGMVTGSSVPVDLNFAVDGWRQGGTPAASHKWHWHFSEHRAYVALWDNKLAMLSVLRGESLDAYLAGGGKLMGDNDMLTPDERQLLANAERILTCWDSRRNAVGVTYLGSDEPEPEYKNPFVHLAEQLEALKVPAPAPVDPAVIEAAVRSALKDPAVLAGIAKAVADEDHRRSAE